MWNSPLTAHIFNYNCDKDNIFSVSTLFDQQKFSIKFGTMHAITYLCNLFLKKTFYCIWLYEPPSVKNGALFFCVSYLYSTPSPLKKLSAQCKNVKM